LQNHRQAFPIHPRAKEVEGFPAYPDLASVPVPVHGVSIITPPDVTESVVEQAAKAGIKHLWMQPGAESAEAIAKAVDSGMNVIHSGPCLLVLLGYRERAQ
jgi:predicted CoA-binding protein